MFWSKNKKKVYPCKPQFYYIKVGCKGVFVTRTCFRDVKRKSNFKFHIFENLSWLTTSSDNDNASSNLVTFFTKKKSILEVFTKIHFYQKKMQNVF